MPKVTGFKTIDVRFPTSRGLDGSDAMNKEPDYSAALVILETDDPQIQGMALSLPADAVTIYSAMLFLSLRRMQLAAMLQI